MAAKIIQHFACFRIFPGISKLMAIAYPAIPKFILPIVNIPCFIEFIA